MESPFPSPIFNAVDSKAPHYSKPSKKSTHKLKPKKPKPSLTVITGKPTIYFLKTKNPLITLSDTQQNQFYLNSRISTAKYDITRINTPQSRYHQSRVSTAITRPSTTTTLFDGDVINSILVVDNKVPSGRKKREFQTATPKRNVIPCGSIIEDDDQEEWKTRPNTSPNLKLVSDNFVANDSDREFIVPQNNSIMNTLYEKTPRGPVKILPKVSLGIGKDEHVKMKKQMVYDGGIPFPENSINKQKVLKTISITPPKIFRNQYINQIISSIHASQVWNRFPNLIPDTKTIYNIQQQYNSPRQKLDSSTTKFINQLPKKGYIPISNGKTVYSTEIIQQLLNSSILCGSTTKLLLSKIEEACQDYALNWVEINLQKMTQLLLTNWTGKFDKQDFVSLLMDHEVIDKVLSKGSLYKGKNREYHAATKIQSYWRMYQLKPMHEQMLGYLKAVSMIRKLWFKKMFRRDLKKMIEGGHTYAVINLQQRRPSVVTVTEGRRPFLTAEMFSDNKHYIMHVTGNQLMQTIPESLSLVTMEDYGKETLSPDFAPGYGIVRESQIPTGLSQMEYLTILEKEVDLDLDKELAQEANLKKLQEQELRMMMKYKGNMDMVMIQLSSLRSSKDEDSNFSARAIVLTQKVVKKYYKNGKIDSSENDAMVQKTLDRLKNRMKMKRKDGYVGPGPHVRPSLRRKASLFKVLTEVAKINVLTTDLRRRSSSKIPGMTLDESTRLEYKRKEFFTNLNKLEANPEMEQMPEMKEVIMQKQKLGNIFGRILGDGKADKIMEASQESLVSDTDLVLPKLEPIYTTTSMPKNEEKKEDKKLAANIFASEAETVTAAKQTVVPVLDASDEQIDVNEDTVSESGPWMLSTARRTFSPPVIRKMGRTFVAGPSKKVAELDEDVQMDDPIEADGEEEEKASGVRVKEGGRRKMSVRQTARMDS